MYIIVPIFITRYFNFLSYKRRKHLLITKRRKKIKFKFQKQNIKIVKMRFSPKIM